MGTKAAHLRPPAPLRVYIAGPYSAATEKERVANVQVAIDAGIEVYRKGHFPFIPHLTHYVDLRSVQLGAGLEWKDYIEWDLEWLKCCDAILFLGSSRGADIELRAARSFGLLVFGTVDEVPPANRKVVTAE